MSYAGAALLGVVTGLRSQLPFALIAWVDGDSAANPLPWPLRGVVGRGGALLAAAGELIGDKLPQTPSRMDPAPLGGRLVLGAAAGAAVARRSGVAALPAALLGAAGAYGGAYLGHRLRAALTRATRLPDPLWGAVEDVAAIRIGLAALRFGRP